LITAGGIASPYWSYETAAEELLLLLLPEKPSLCPRPRLVRPPPPPLFEAQSLRRRGCLAGFSPALLLPLELRLGSASAANTVEAELEAAAEEEARAKIAAEAALIDETDDELTRAPLPPRNNELDDAGAAAAAAEEAAAAARRAASARARLIVSQAGRGRRRSRRSLQKREVIVV
jgi:hypothetical protein